AERPGARNHPLQGSVPEPRRARRAVDPILLVGEGLDGPSQSLPPGGCAGKSRRSNAAHQTGTCARSLPATPSHADVAEAMHDRCGYNEDVSLPSTAIDALVVGAHRDPFSVLRPHADTGAAVTVRAFLPEARDVAVVSGGSEEDARPLHRVHPAGL